MENEPTVVLDNPMEQVKNVILSINKGWPRITGSFHGEAKDK